MVEVLQTPLFEKQIKKFHKNQIQDLETAINKIIKDPSIGAVKKGDINGIQIFKFSMVNQLTLLIYEFFENPPRLILLSVGSHENFYRDLKH
jgi:mRNA-degrading endonuclease RelE of RelBE toxin-antitoxin system